MSAGQETREKILKAAETVFIRYGYEGARMEQIAEEAGVLKANIYYYFKGKEGLYDALITSVLGDVLSGVSSFLTDLQDESPWGRLDAFLDVFFDIVDRYRGLLPLAFGEIIHPPRDRETESNAAMLLRQIEAIALELIKEGQGSSFNVYDPGHTLVTLEAAIFHYFIIPDEHLKRITGGGRFDPERLAAHKEHLRGTLRRILGG